VEEEAARLKAMSDNEKQSVNKSQRTVFVGNVSIAATEKQIRELFKEHGEVESVRLRSVPLAGVKVDDHGNQDLVKRISANKGKMGDQKESQNAYIVFAAVDSVARAIKALDNVKFLTRTLRVDTESPSLFDTSTTVFLGGLSKFCDEERLREFFAKVLPNGQADITGMRLVRDTETLYGKGFGYIMLADRDGVMGALKNDGKRFKGRDMRVTTCGKRTKRQAKERTVPRVPKAEGDSDAGAGAEGGAVGEGEGEGEGEMSKKEKKKNKKPTEFEVAAARRMKQKMAKSIAKMKQQKQVGLNKNLKKGRKLGGVIKKALKATSGKTGKAQGLNKGTKSEARFKPSKVKAR
jgi:nucleolar protein 12